MALKASRSIEELCPDGRERNDVCTCVKDLEEKAHESFRATSRFKKPVERVRMGGISFPIIDGKLLMRTTNELQVTLEGQRKVESVSMMHSYCPFCGTKYETS